MNTSHSDDAARAHPTTGEPVNLAELLALARTGSAIQRQAPVQAAENNAAGSLPEGDPYLQFTCADVACAAPITSFREVLPTLPITIALPYSPPWMLGIFALHTELIGLVDPAPLLFEAPDLVGLSRSRAHNGQVIVPGARHHTNANWRLATPESGPTALIVGAGERTLALAVGGVGELIFAGADQVHGVPAESTSTRTPAARFHAGMLAPHPGLPGQAPSYLVRMDALVDELLAALTPVEAAHE